MIGINILLASVSAVLVTDAVDRDRRRVLTGAVLMAPTEDDLEYFSSLFSGDERVYRLTPEETVYDDDRVFERLYVDQMLNGPYSSFSFSETIMLDHEPLLWSPFEPIPGHEGRFVSAPLDTSRPSQVSGRKPRPTRRG